MLRLRYDYPELCPTDFGKEDLSSSGLCTSAVCGDGVRESFEACDDGNGNNGDGCSQFCQVEPGYNCSSVGWNTISIVILCTYMLKNCGTLGYAVCTCKSH